MEAEYISEAEFELSTYLRQDLNPNSKVYTLSTAPSSWHPKVSFFNEAFHHNEKRQCQNTQQSYSVRRKGGNVSRVVHLTPTSGLWQVQVMNCYFIYVWPDHCKWPFMLFHLLWITNKYPDGPNKKLITSYEKILEPVPVILVKIRHVSLYITLTSLF